MNSVIIFWFLIALIAGILLLLAIREARLVWRVPVGHPERGYYWFNMFFLIAASCAVVWGGNYLDSGRQELESLISSPPGSRYAIERNSVLHATSWVYTTNQGGEYIRNFYREYAREHGIGFIEDDHDGVRMSFGLPSGNLYLTLHQEGKETVLYFSREGEAIVVIIPASPEPQE